MIWTSHFTFSNYLKYTDTRFNVLNVTKYRTLISCLHQFDNIYPVQILLPHMIPPETTPKSGGS